MENNKFSDKEEKKKIIKEYFKNHGIKGGKTEEQPENEALVRIDKQK